ncbi:hypothetical protein [Chroococcidiopsis sp.]|uniref:hypothetical protein n=1 Tax=Chroococcidiopsis sp. TaxID=3088168 RepID=UPI003F2AF2C6
MDNCPDYDSDQLDQVVVSVTQLMIRSGDIVLHALQSDFAGSSEEMDVYTFNLDELDETFDELDEEG